MFVPIPFFWIGPMTERTHHDGPCPVERVVAVFGGKWKTAILHSLTDSGRRFNELRRMVPEVTQRMLTKQLRELVRDGLVHREHFPEIPPRVVYSLTPLGLSLVPLFEEIDRWGGDHMGEVYQANARYDVSSTGE
jgi:DNA-binding HxlR family transcriptional regulator